MRAAKSFLVVTGGSAIFFGLAVFVTPNFEAYAGTKAIGPFEASLIDGDTLSDGTVRYRLVGVDACEMGQPIDFSEEPETLDCGYYAMKFMEQFIAILNNASAIPTHLFNFLWRDTARLGVT